MNNRTAALLAEAVELLTENKNNCAPSATKEIDDFIKAPTTVARAVELLYQAKQNAGMFGRGDIIRFINKTDGKGFNEVEYHAERMPEGQ